MIYLRFNNMSPRQYIYLLLICLGASSCIKAPEYPIEPVLTMEGISSDTMRQGNLNNDSIIVFISLTDGDGDIGSDNGGFDVVVTDLRDNFVAYQYRLPKVDPTGANNGISGDLFLTVYTTCCVYTNGQPPCTVSNEFPMDEIQYNIHILDQAGNQSNTVTTPKITLICNGK